VSLTSCTSLQPAERGGQSHRWPTLCCRFPYRGNVCRTHQWYGADALYLATQRAATRRHRDARGHRPAIRYCIGAGIGAGRAKLHGNPMELPPHRGIGICALPRRRQLKGTKRHRLRPPICHRTEEAVFLAVLSNLTLAMQDCRSDGKSSTSGRRSCDGIAYLHASRPSGGSSLNPRVLIQSRKVGVTATASLIRQPRTPSVSDGRRLYQTVG